MTTSEWSRHFKRNQIEALRLVLKLAEQACADPYDKEYQRQNAAIQRMHDVLFAVEYPR